MRNVLERAWKTIDDVCLRCIFKTFRNERKSITTTTARQGTAKTYFPECFNLEMAEG